MVFFGNKKIIKRQKIIKQQRFGLFLLFTLIIIVEIIYHKNVFLDSSKNKEYPIKLSFLPLNLKGKKDTLLNENYILQPFDPNSYSINDLENIGFSNKEAKIILNYKNALGGEFTSKEQLKKCYAISDLKYAEISAYFIFSDLENKKLVKSYKEKIKKNEKAYKLKPFNPNSYSLNDWENIGFSKKQAEIILKYKQSLGGNFKSNSDLKKCFIISSEKYEELLPFLLLTEFEKNKNIIVKVDSPKVKKNYILIQFNPNDYDLKDWINIGFSEKQAQVILKYKAKLGGKFTSIDQLKSCFVISEKKFEELREYIIFQ